MNEVEQIVRNAITQIKGIPKERHDIKWRNKVIARLEEAEAFAHRVPNPNHPFNQPLPEYQGTAAPYTPPAPTTGGHDGGIDLDEIPF